MSKELPNNEEVDLGQLFKLIGKGFSNIAASIRRFFNRILNLFIKTALFIKKHFIKIAIVTVFGFVFGFYKGTTSVKTYSSTIRVSPNYHASKQLYTEITSINNAFSEEESKVQFIKKFGLTEDDDVFATITPIKSNKIELEIFNDFVKKLDTTAIRTADFQSFVNDLSDMDYPIQEITITTTNPIVFGKFSDYLTTEINKNTFLKKRIEINLKNVEFEEKQLKKSLQDIDSLRIIYNKSLLAEANKLNSGTTIITAKQNGNKDNKELALYDKREKIIERLNELSDLKIRKRQSIIFISNFSKYGDSNTKIIETNIVKYGFKAFLLIVLTLLFVQFVAYLKTLE